MLWNRAIEQVKVQWKHFGLDEATWKMTKQKEAMYPSLFSSWGKVFLVWCFGICLGICFGDVGICTYVYGCKYHHELCYKAPISSMGVMLLWLLYSHVVMMFCFEQVFHCKYCNELSYKAPWEVCFVFNSFIGCRCHWTLRMVFPQGGGFCNSPRKKSM